MIKQFLSIFILIVAFASCSKDDICPAETQTTPLLVIEFRNLSNQLETKAVTALRILVNDADSTEVFMSTATDTLISIPLNTETDVTEFQFISNSTDTLLTNTDIVRFTYSTEDIYLNRACAFKRIYNNFDLGIESEPGNTEWIRNTEVLKTTIEDETEPHLTIFH